MSIATIMPFAPAHTGACKYLISRYEDRVVPLWVTKDVTGLLTYRVTEAGSIGVAKLQNECGYKQPE